jgi:multiple antibiotic resistance protein
MALIVLAIMALNLACLLSADRIIKAIGPSGLQIIARVAGVLLSALAVQLMILGFRDLGLIDAALVH